MYAKKSLGQNFLIDPNYRRKIVAALAPSPQDVILEIGGGKGILSEAIAPLCKQLIVVEKDERLALELKGKFSQMDHVQVMTDDFLKVDLSKILPSTLCKRGVGGDLKVVGNLPYNVASQIFIKLIENRRYTSEMFLMFQKEMALRFVAKPSTKDYGLLTLWAQIYTDANILFHLPPTVFSPKPKVQSSFLRFKLREKSILPDDEKEEFFSLMRLIFQKRRKTLKGILKKIPGLNLLVIETMDKNLRAEALSVEELIKCYFFASAGMRMP